MSGASVKDKATAGCFLIVLAVVLLFIAGCWTDNICERYWKHAEKMQQMRHDHERPGYWQERLENDKRIKEIEKLEGKSPFDHSDLVPGVPGK